MDDEDFCISASAPAKVILHGEHSVVYGKTALAASLDLRTKSTIKRLAKKQRIRINFPDTGCTFDFAVEVFRPLTVHVNADEATTNSLSVDLKDQITSALSDHYPDQQQDDLGIVALLYLYVAIGADFGLQLPNIEVTVTSDIPIGAGLGSSAAFSVSLAGAMYHFFKAKDSSFSTTTTTTKTCLDVICRWAFKAEKILHGNPSGLDNSICTYGGLLSYTSGKPNIPLNVPACSSLLRILLINSCVSRNTRALVSKVREQRVNLLPKVTAAILDAMDRVAKEAIDTLALLLNNNNNKKSSHHTNGMIHHEHDQGLFHKLEQLIDTNQGLLGALGVSHHSLEMITSIAAKQKMHAKLTGAGGGGFAFALITPWHSDEQIDLARKDLEELGFQCWETQLAGEGLRLEQ